jgi:hypothetical protein
MKIAIIGSGIAGLFSGLIIKNSIKDSKITIFEKNSEIGGRIKTVNFDGKEVIAGAGIGRKQDKLLYELCKNLNVTINVYHADFEHTSKPIDIAKVLSILKDNFHMLERNKENFKEFATKILGKEIYNEFLFSTGETDYEKADVVDTIFDYGFENYTSSGFDAFSIKWNELLKSFEKLLKDNIKLNINIKKISIQSDGKIKINKEIFDKVILATPANVIRKLLPKMKIFNYIDGQPFVRLYVKLDKPLNVTKTFIKTAKPFQKIIVIDKKKYIYQISYSDNKIANRWKNVENIRKVVENGILKIFDQKVKVLKHKLIYWENGTHYYKPLPKEFRNREEFLDICQNPEKNIFCVGEAFSRNQGWSEGALESVLKIINKIRN